MAFHGLTTHFFLVFTSILLAEGTIDCLSHCLLIQGTEVDGAMFTSAVGLFLFQLKNIYSQKIHRSCRIRLKNFSSQLCVRTLIWFPLIFFRLGAYQSQILGSDLKHDNEVGGW